MNDSSQATARRVTSAFGSDLVAPARRHRITLVPPRHVEELRAAGGAVGMPGEVVDITGRYASAGVSRLYLQTLDLSDLDHVDWWGRLWRPSSADQRTGAERPRDGPPGPAAPRRGQRPGVVDAQ